MLTLLKQPLSAALAFSLALHAFVLFGIGFALPDPRKAADFLQPLQVVLVNSKSQTRPLRADALAQSNLDGGGNTLEEHRAKTPLPALSDDKQFTPEQNARRVQRLEQEQKRLLTQIKSTHSVPQEQKEEKPQQQESERVTGEDLVRRSLEIARLEAQISKDFSTYQKMPRRKFIGARVQEYRFAQYVEDWRIKVERIGNLNYPEAARQQKIYGSLQLTVSIRADGSVESVEVNRPSGQRILDAAALRIVKLASPFAPLPPDIRRDTDILSITRTWTFTQSDKLESE
ncbi:MAG: energy transducer TonB [Nitrosomonadales bacterium]|nr:energy transducer TonB [Nitrosomonadales bacterium]